MKVLVTGSSGTLGGYVLRELLAAGHDVCDYSLAPPRVEGIQFIRGDICAPDQLKEACRGRDAVIHMAGIPGPGRATLEQILNVNVVGVAHALEAARQGGARKFVLASSGAATGFTFQKRELVPRYLPLDEQHSSEPHDEYGLSKLLAEITCKRYTDAFDMQTICLRINHNWYLDRPGAQTAVGAGWATGFSTVEELWAARYLKTLTEPEGEWPVPGPPRPRNLLWAVTDARDAAQAFRLAVENDTLRHEVFLINGDDTCALEETPTLIARWLPTVPLKKPLAGYNSLLSHEKATRLLGYRPRYTWRKSDFRDWMENHLVATGRSDGVQKRSTIRRAKVLYLSPPDGPALWAEKVIEAVGPRHDLSVYDPKKPIADQFRGIEVVLDHGGSVGTREMYDAGENVRLWQILGTGLDHVDVQYMSTKNFKIANCPGQFSSTALAECAMMFILMLSRRMFEAAANFKRRVFQEPSGRELGGRVLGIVGFGGSGQELARRAKSFGMHIHALDVRKIEPSVIEELRPEFLGTPADLDRVVAESDYLSFHLHLTPETKHIIDARRIGLMKPTACIINVARGALVDQEAMYQALLSGRLRGAGLDVFCPEPPDTTHPVFQLPNVVVTPHVAGTTDGTARNRAAVAVANADRVAQGLEPLYQVGNGYGDHLETATDGKTQVQR